jgi:hypothetical protein
MANKEQLKAELGSLNVGYDDEMTNKELQALLDDTTDAQEEPETETDEAPVAQAPEVTMGVGTINDHEKRIFELEQVVIELGKLIEASKE